jgi:hypothetical protein
MQDKFIRVLRLDFKRRHNIHRKIPHARRDDHVGPLPDCPRQHVPVVRIWKMQPFDQIFIAGNKGIRRMLVHDHPRPLKFFTRAIGTVSQQGGNPFLVHAVRPSGAEQSRHGQMHQQIPQLGGIQNVRVVKSREVGHGV